MVPAAVEKLWSTCATFFQRLKKSDEAFLHEKVVETLASYGIDPAVMRERAVRFAIIVVYSYSTGRKKNLGVDLPPV